MLNDLMGAYGGNLLIAVVGVGIGLLVLIGVLWFIRGRTGPSPFVRGGKNRQPRLQVLDAAAVDTRRRLVLIRRDEVEHLIMIGGPTDIVIESGISTAAAARQAIPATPANRFQPLDMTVPVQAALAMEARPALVAEPRPAPIPRPAAPETRVEPARDSVVPPRETARAAPPAVPTAAPIAGPIPMSGTLAPRPAPPAPAANAAAPEPMATPRIEPPARQAPEVKPEPLRPIAALAAAMSAPNSPATAAPAPQAAAPAQAPAFDDAVDMLDAARGRVFQEAPEPRVVPVSAAIVPPALQSAADKPKQLGSDFERILEQEMANNLAARETVAVPQPNNRQTPQRHPGVPPVTGATPEPSLQAEVARIFGEMSVTRDK